MNQMGQLPKPSKATKWKLGHLHFANSIEAFNSGKDENWITIFTNALYIHFYWIVKLISRIFLLIIKFELYFKRHKNFLYAIYLNNI